MRTERPRSMTLATGCHLGRTRLSCLVATRHVVVASGAHNISPPPQSQRGPGAVADFAVKGRLLRQFDVLPVDRDDLFDAGVAFVARDLVAGLVRVGGVAGNPAVDCRAQQQGSPRIVYVDGAARRAGARARPRASWRTARSPCCRSSTTRAACSSSPGVSTGSPIQAVCGRCGSAAGWRTPLAPLARLLVRREARNLERLRGW